MSTTLTAPAQPFNAADMATATKVFAFATMCIGMFIALLDIQIVSASLRDIGGGLSAGTDETAWVQTSYLIAEIIVIPLSGWLSRCSPPAGCSLLRRSASPWPVCFAAWRGTSRA
jgi:DHA2 family multidrug resistance protein